MNSDAQTTITLDLGRERPLVLRGGDAHEARADGTLSRLEAVQITPIAQWTSLRTLASYPSAWRVQSDALGTLHVHAVGGGEETDEPSPTWRGSVTIEGPSGTTLGTGTAWQQVASPTVAELLIRAGEATRSAVAALLGHDPSGAALQRLIGAPDRADWLHGADVDACNAALIAPLRYTVDLGGKAWRSLLLIASADLVGGDPEKLRPWLAVPEIVHSGSLMVDDVQDGSPLRRGGAASHLLHGVPLAVNAGTFGYLVADVLIRESGLPAERRAWLYEAFVGALRAAHAGQALDIAGLDPYAPADRLCAQLHAIHRLKSGVPTAAGARMGAILGGGDAEQVEIIGRYAEALGLAYQIRDDVLDVRGHDGRKERGEDLRNGKITFPFIEALALLPDSDARALRQAVADPGGAVHATPALVALLASCGATEQCEARATAMVDEAWARLDDAFPSSPAKRLLRVVSDALLGRPASSR